MLTTKPPVVDELRTRLGALPTELLRSPLAAHPHTAEMQAAAVSFEWRETLASKHEGSSLLHLYSGELFPDAPDIPLMSGRGFQAQAGQTEPVVVLSESAAQLLCPGQNPIGRSLRLGTDGMFHGKNEFLPDGPTYRVVGVARDTRGVLLDGSDSELIYVPLPEGRLQDYPIIIRTRSNPALIMGAIGQAISSTDPDLVATIRPLDELLHQTPAFLIPSLSAAFASAVGLLGLLLASMGIYGTVSYIVVLRTREVGIRIALGASRRDILGLMLQQGMRPVLAGLLVGLSLAVGASYLLRGVLLWTEERRQYFIHRGFNSVSHYRAARFLLALTASHARRSHGRAQI